MINLTCKTCGSNNFKEEINRYVCQYCSTTIIKPPYYSKKKFRIIILLLLIIVIAVFLGYKLLYSVKNDIQYLTKIHTQNTNIKQELKTEYIYNDYMKNTTGVYSLQPTHPSSYIPSPKNKIQLVKTFLKTDSILKTEVIKVLGTFVSLPKEYDINYSDVNKPKNGYNNYTFYKETPYHNMSQSSMYASASMSELIDKIIIDIDNGDCKKWSANTHGGNLNRDDNFWTKFCPKPAIVTHLKSIKVISTKTTN